MHIFNEKSPLPIAPRLLAISSAKPSPCATLCGWHFSAAVICGTPEWSRRFCKHVMVWNGLGPWALKFLLIILLKFKYSRCHAPKKKWMIVNLNLKPTGIDVYTFLHRSCGKQKPIAIVTFRRGLTIYKKWIVWSMLSPSTGGPAMKSLQMKRPLERPNHSRIWTVPPEMGWIRPKSRVLWVLICVPPSLWENSPSASHRYCNLMIWTKSED